MVYNLYDSKGRKILGETGKEKTSLFICYQLKRVVCKVSLLILCLPGHNKRAPIKQLTKKAYVRTKEYVWRQNKRRSKLLISNSLYNICNFNILFNLILHSNKVAVKLISMSFYIVATVCIEVNCVMLRLVEILRLLREENMLILYN